MDREIKFRVWDVENKEMLEVQELDFEPTFYGGRIAIRPDQYSDYFDPEDMILMQYTGLHDKNGKEIYEGDIVRITGSKEIDIGKVIYEYNGFTVDVMNMDRFYGRVHLLEKFTEVIGNVFENGDILNDSKNTEKN